MTPDSFAALLDRAAGQIGLQIKLAETETLEDAKRFAIEFTSGTLTPADLHRLDYPYARRHGSPLRDPGITNEQSGVLKGSWETDGPKEAAGDLVSSVFNTDPKAPYLEQPDGAPSSKMFARPVDEKIAAQVNPLREARLQRALRDAFK